MDKPEEKLPEGWAWFTAARDFITPWGPRYTAGQALKLSAEQAEELADKNVLEELQSPEKSRAPASASKDDDNAKKAKK